MQIRKEQNALINVVWAYVFISAVQDILGNMFSFFKLFRAVPPCTFESVQTALITALPTPPQKTAFLQHSILTWHLFHSGIVQKFPLGPKDFAGKLFSRIRAKSCSHS